MRGLNIRVFQDRDAARLVQGQHAVGRKNGI
jgi:hypothetical protein